MLSFFPRDVLDETLNLIESVSEGFPSYSCVRRPERLPVCFGMRLVDGHGVRPQELGQDV